ncbi:MAG TPA: GldG family protein [Bryobacteraceae bacterium]|nr:GldG family protein [Bryobacteraceae bacterium]
MSTPFLQQKSTKYTAYVTVYGLVIVGALGVANFLAQRHNKSLDTTSNKKFSLSDQTEKIVKNLKTDAKITYFDKQSSFNQAKDLLDRYDALSPKLSVDYIDPDKNPQVARANAVSRYGTIYIDVSGKREEAKSLSEEEVSGAFIRALKGGKRTVCVVGGSGEHSLDSTDRSGYSQFKELLEKNNYQVQAISLIEKPEVPKNCTIVMVGGPRFDYLPPAVNALKSFVEGGGRALFLIDPPLKLGKEQVSDNAALTAVLKEWGVTLNADLVLDTSGIGQLFGFSAAIPLVASYESHQIVKDLREVTTAFPMSRSIDSTNGAKTTVEKLFSTSAKSFATTRLDKPEIDIDPDKDKKGPFALGVAGRFNTGNPNQEGLFVVVGSSQWASNSILRFNGNSDLAMNMMNWLSSDNDLISIRPKDPENRPLNMNASQMRVIFFASVLFLPLAIVLAGVSVWWRRR